MRQVREDGYGERQREGREGDKGERKRKRERDVITVATHVHNCIRFNHI